MWCAREDLNLQSLRNQILSLACLPFHHARSVEFLIVLAGFGFLLTLHPGLESWLHCILDSIPTGLAKSKARIDCLSNDGKGGHAPKGRTCRITPAAGITMAELRLAAS